MNAEETFDEIEELTPQQLQHTLETFGLRSGEAGLGLYWGPCHSTWEESQNN